ncbi:MAG: rhodanese-like domain-containing protein [Gracilimonas sp.]|uniref:rhodanese-like domain-containing protein n=1 Tax=Gracilimonas sp. TaxID=1974203 RepID=UPI0019B40AA1|nr:rhodanese-like domain-containing protein [Gracilimonas sp.]MBD3617221.1 rhodanese-like domain-containing protein [Gracilimonas sp.]
MKSITVHELNKKKENEESFFLLDVREYHEYLVSNIGGHHIPYNDLESRMNEIEEYKDSKVIVMCRSGNTSKDAAETLLNSGFKNVFSLEGGMKKWAKEIDPSLPVI